MCSMKKVLFSTVAMSALMLMATSCADDQTSDLKAGAESTVTITAQLPGDMGTRAFADGTKATELHYAVYEKGTTTPLEVCKKADGTKGQEGTATMTGLKTTISLQLTTGKEYDFVFWADAPGDNVYTFNSENQTVTVNYANAENNTDNLDAFFGQKKALMVSGNMSISQELRRPFAQINIGTDDFDAAAAAGYTVSESTIGVATYNTLNLLSGEVSDPVTATFVKKPIPTEDSKFSVNSKDYKYLSMSYVLVPKDKETVDIAFDYTLTNRTFTNVPVQRNYRTNIYGSLLTNTADFNVVIVPGFNDPDYNHNVITASTQDELKTAAQTPNAVIKLKEHTTYTLPKTVAEGVTFSGDETTVISIPQAIGYDGKTIGFSGVTVKSPNALYTGIQHAKAVTYTGCVIEGQPFSYAEEAVYNSCTFKQTSSGHYNIWTYGSKDITFNSCQFECAGKSVLIYNEGATVIVQNATFNNCEFIASAPVDGKAAIEVDSSLISGTFVININHCTATGFGKGSNSGNSLWNVKTDKTEKHHSQVFVDRTQVY